MDSSKTVIRNIRWLVAWDGRQHVYINGSDLAFANGRITAIGNALPVEDAIEIDGSDLLVMPGLIDIHTHAQSEPMRKGITDETHSPGFWHSSLYEHLPVFEPVDEEGRLACLYTSIGELLLSGVTTVVDLSMPFDGWLDVLAESGVRAVVAPMFRDARWFTKDGHSLDYDWNPDNGRQGFETARRVIELARQHPCGRLDGMIAPSQVDTCSENLLRDSHAYATERNLPWTIHAAQSVTEFHEMQRRHGKTPIAWLDEIGVLDDRSLIAHCIFLDHHPWIHWTSQTDLDRMGDNGATVAHCPTVFSRRGIALNTLGSYIRHGVSVGLGTDTYPHNMLDEMRTAAIAARLVGETVDDLDYSDVFDAATVVGAAALRRDDLGRLTPGACADIVAIDLKHPAMMPVRDPLRTLLVVAAERAVRDVWVDGRHIVQTGKLKTVDMPRVLQELELAQKRMMALVPRRDWAGRTVDELAPMILKVADASALSGTDTTERGTCTHSDS